MLIPLRPVDRDWTCQQSGDCCRMVESVTMTTQERDAVMQYAWKHLPIRVLNLVNFAPMVGHPNFVELKAGPCPFLDGNLCSVHSVRPYNCRRFGCLRPNVKTEPLVMAPLSVVAKYGTVGCSNLRERLVQSARARKIYDLLQRRGRRWALSHGWRSDHATGQ